MDPLFEPTFLLQKLCLKILIVIKFLLVLFTSPALVPATAKHNGFKSPTIWDITPCRPLNVNRHLGGTCLLYLQGRRISPERNQHETGSKWRPTLLKMEAKCSSETSVDIQWKTWRYNPEDKNSS
jgi:hypothetical protein